MTTQNETVLAVQEVKDQEQVQFRSGGATFNGCGQVTHTTPDGTRTITLNSCQ